MSMCPRRIVYYLSLLGVVMFGYALIYHYGMATFEEESVTFLHSLLVVVESLGIIHTMGVSGLMEVNADF